MKIEDFSVLEIKQGYVFCQESRSYRCIVCGDVFAVGEIYAVGDRFFEAVRAIELHMESEHKEYLSRLIDSDSKYNTLTENQQNLFRLFAADISDKDIAKELGVSMSTVRHQKFMFREKAKQAKLYLAIYDRVFENKSTGKNAMMPIHDHAKLVDDRYVVTEEEREHILQISFSSFDPLKLKVFSPKEKKKVVVLSKISELFDTGKQYTEIEVNHILKSVFEDFVTLRRYLIEYGFMKRNKEGTKYWLT